MFPLEHWLENSGFLCDNDASFEVLNSGSTRDALMQILREICLYAANLQFEVKAKHISGQNNRLPGYLSRWEIDIKYRTLFKNSMVRKRIKINKKDHKGLRFRSYYNQRYL